MNTTTTQAVEVEITYRNGYGDTVTTIGRFESIENMTELLRIYPGNQLLGIQFINNK